MMPTLEPPQFIAGSMSVPVIRINTVLPDFEDDHMMILLENDEFFQTIMEGRKSPAAHRHIHRTAELMGGAKTIKDKKKRALGRSNKFNELLMDYTTALSKEWKRFKKTESIKKSEKRFKKTFSDFFEKAFSMGRETSGLKPKKNAPSWTAEDSLYIKNAVLEEWGYIKGFMKQYRLGQLRMDEGKRLGLYAKGLNGIYGSGRISGLPETVAIYWTGPNDKNKCESCRYLAGASPFVPANLPCVPKDGTTLCLTNCRDVLVVKKISVNETIEIAQNSQTKGEHIRRLESIRENRKKKGRHRA